MVKLAYLITSCARAPFPVQAQVAGRTVEASIEGLVIEATSADGSMGHTFRLTPDDLGEAEAEFARGNTLTVALSGAPGE